MGSVSEEQFVNELLDDLEKDKLVLPTLPEVALRVRDTLSDELKSLADVATIITTDTALSARLIQIANSPLLRTSRAIESVEGAVTRLGGDMIRNLVTSARRALSFTIRRWSKRNRSSSSPMDRADWYLFSGSFSSARKRIATSSSGIWLSMLLGSGVSL